MPNYVLGKDGKLYYSATVLTSTSSATPLASATEVTIAQDVTSNMTKDTVEIATRGSGGFKTKVGTQKEATIKFKVLWVPGNAVFTAFRNAYLNDTELAVWALDLDKATSGTQGPAGNFVVVDFTRDEPLSGVMTASVELSPSSYTHYFGS